MYKNLYIKYTQKINFVNNQQQIGAGKYTYSWQNKYNTISILNVNYNDQIIIDSAYERCINNKIGNIQNVEVVHLGTKFNTKSIFCIIRFTKKYDGMVYAEIKTDAIISSWLPLDITTLQQNFTIPQNIHNLNWNPNERQIQIWGLALFIVLNNNKRPIPGTNVAKITDYEHATLISSVKGIKLNFHPSFIYALQNLITNIIITLNLSPPGPKASFAQNRFRDIRNSLTDLIIQYLNSSNQQYILPHQYPNALININGNMQEYNLINNSLISLEIHSW